jgi:hypothetical protein
MALNQRRHPPAVAPTEDMQGVPDTFYNVSRFLITASPLRMPGVVDSPVTPVVTV